MYLKYTGVYDPVNGVVSDFRVPVLPPEKRAPSSHLGKPIQSLGKTMSSHLGRNLEQLMGAAGLSVRGLSQRSGLGERTIRAALGGTNKPQLRTIQRLAEGLDVTVADLLHNSSETNRQDFDRRTNPALEDVLQSEPKLFLGWTEADFGELHSRVGAGGALTEEGTIATARQMNHQRQIREKLDLLLESSHAELIGRIIDLLHGQVVVR